ncbi:ABC transporter substrate-binding protein [Rhizobium johnstonii]|uniref:ABC transporter substrate-binding protein n=1 Tax=Rhizobium TaxID=379 RepID=UPI0010325841|nr:ABC transporter substrate-binding protein [Rhizobium leguminosarum]TBF70811.1 peptide ABC transporter [Rhizobium leguminosarum]TBG93320.1 peptide ABC transporter [Rhizobium leguminosarum]TBG98722.1 peptide ABC transporter [Rhizobium leguminosarum]TBH29935.1 peptide ABC transporter [Rhizobium leguminosarum]TBH50165.1 peptide ABC transporter [Rhizobium leguminosarum]
MSLKFASAAAFALALMASTATAQSTKDTLTVDLPNDAATLDPHLQWDTDSYTIYRNIYDNLITRDTSGQIVPQIATAWKYLDDKTLEFQIRDDVSFQDGSKLTADDVAFSINRIIDPALKSPQLSQFDQIIKAEATGPTTVKMTTKSPYPALLAQLVKLSIVPKAYVEKVGNQEFNLKPMGSGPYKVAQWQKGVQTELEANDHYWRAKPPFARVVFRAVPDVSTRLADLKTGKADLVRDLPADQAIDLKSDTNAQVLSVPTERVGYIYINAQAGATKDVRVRQAIAYAIDKQGLIDALLQGFGSQVNVLGAAPIFGYTDKVEGYGFDPDKARELIKEAGAEGAKVEFLTSPSYDRAMVEAIQQMLNDVGLDTSITSLDQATFLKRRQGDAANAGSIALGKWSCACQDADGVIFPLFRTGSSWAKYSNPEFDKLVDDARGTLNNDQRLQDYQKAYEILKDDVPGLGLYQVDAVYGASKDLKWQPSPNEAMFVMDMSWQQ